MLTSFPQQLPWQPVSRQKEEAKRRHSEATLPPRNHPEESIPGSRVLWVKHRSEHGGVEAAGLPFLHEQPGCIGATCCHSSYLPQGRREGLSCVQPWQLPHSPEGVAKMSSETQPAPTPSALSKLPPRLLTCEEATSLGRPSEGQASVTCSWRCPSHAVPWEGPKSPCSSLAIFRSNGMDVP